MTRRGTLLSALALAAIGACGRTAFQSFPNSSTSSTSTATPSPPALSWWDTTFAYRRPLTIVAGSAAVDTGYSLALAFDHASLVSAGKAAVDGSDARMARYDGTEWYEVNRVLDAGSLWNAATTTIWFATTAAIGAGRTDQSYFLYYGKSGHSTPLDDPNRVFLLFDGFENNSIGNWGIFNAAGAGTFSADNTQAHSGSHSMLAKGPFGNDKYALWPAPQADVSLDAFWRVSDPADNAAQMVRASVAAAVLSSGWEAGSTTGIFFDIGEMDPGYRQYLVNPQDPRAVPANQWFRVTTQVSGSRMRVLYDGTGVTPASGFVTLDGSAGGSRVGFDADLSGATQSWWIDDVSVRKLVIPEPVTTLGAEQTQH